MKRYIVEKSRIKGKKRREKPINEPFLGGQRELIKRISDKTSIRVELFKIIDR